MVRKCLLTLLVLGFITPACLWSAALIVAWLEPDGRPCLAGGFAGGDRWLISAVFYTDGHVLVQYFPRNLSRHRGPYLKLSRMNARHDFSWRSLVPNHRTTAVSSAWMMHELTVIVPFAFPAGLMMVTPRMRRRRRRKRGLCLRCGYDLRGATLGVCSECGKAISDGR